MEIGHNWHKWKEILGAAVGLGEKAGMENETINNAAFRLGDFFANNFDPANDEQRLMKELWEQGNDEEKKTLASLMARASHKANHH
ncbi:DUF3243 domain-containing protein [Desulforamulus aquiferis]|uniref:DUF3243 domain-containing protein n=1 Tax=Desulforamulus aquiferis TaxID=1397668 RepID=A0AAW7ZHB4_9FIRM|nr:DUF3243 domain-containing protein [Desulforamulus aquiferis]MDO7788692.1 DUF3243 domain-containing protein [Desulforamulus aquiferis]RYD06481.1 hypothetical protein N752_03910 [Desulforamulus aquiferis]